MTKEEEFEAMKILLCSLERRVEELEREKRLSFPVDAFGNVGTVGSWDKLKEESKTNTPFYLKTATI